MVFVKHEVSGHIPGAFVEYDGEQLRADYHVRFRKGWSQEVE